MIYDMTHLLTAVGLTYVFSITVQIYTQKIQRTKHSETEHLERN